MASAAAPATPYGGASVYSSAASPAPSQASFGVGTPGRIGSVRSATNAYAPSPMDSTPMSPVHPLGPGNSYYSSQGSVPPPTLSSYNMDEASIGSVHGPSSVYSTAAAGSGGGGLYSLPVGVYVKVSITCGDASVGGRVGILRSEVMSGLVTVDFPELEKRVTLKPEHLSHITPSEGDRVCTYSYLYFTANCL